MIVNVRTKDDLRELLRNRASGNWKIGRANEPSITKVRVFNWDIEQVLKGDYNKMRSVWDAKGRLVIGIENCRIENFYRQKKTWKSVFGQSSFLYSEEVSLQKKGNQVVGIVRSDLSSGMSTSEIKYYFERLKREIKLRGLTKIVFKKGGIPLPESFIIWCTANGVEIEILPENEFNNRYPLQNDIFWEDELFEQGHNNDVVR
jgi:hypothetical protein